METWLIFAICSIFSGWLYNFTMKVAAERKYDVALINVYSYWIMLLLTWFYLAFNEIIVAKDVLLMLVVFSFINWFLFLLSLFSRVESLKNIDTVIFFPLYKTFWPIIVTLISIFYFKESLVFNEILWIIVGITVPLLLITKNENKIQTNLYRWIYFLLITVILTAITSAITKEIMIREYDVFAFIFFVSFFWLLLAHITYKLQKKRKKVYNWKWVMKFSIITSVLHLSTFMFFTFALEWNLAIVFTINSFSILIPIILSIFYYKEHFSFKKGLVILLSIVSVLLFI